jgi:hypothetical protein
MYDESDTAFWNPSDMPCTRDASTPAIARPKEEINAR